MRPAIDHVTAASLVTALLIRGCVSMNTLSVRQATPSRVTMLSSTCASMRASTPRARSNVFCAGGAALWGRRGTSASAIARAQSQGRVVIHCGYVGARGGGPQVSIHNVVQSLKD